uniref:uncharacterized protein LOC122608177 n=1 Tax=Erigeron canadensis TaxID=72917 RepID=UPI001CB95808|nr:uncharacterized protein LOC122608177 [Erigeron canadensis]
MTSSTKLPKSESRDLECLPLKQRLKMLHAKQQKQLISQNIIYPNVAVNKEDGFRNSRGFQYDQDDSEGRSNSASCKQSQHGTTHTVRTPPLHARMLSHKLEKECTTAEDESVVQLLNCQCPSSTDDNEMSDDFFEDFDHVVLKERQRMLLSRKLVGSSKPVMEYTTVNPSTKSADLSLPSAGIGSGGWDICGIRSVTGGNDTIEKCDGNVYASCDTLESHLLNDITTDAPTWIYRHQEDTLTFSNNDKNVHGAESCSGRSIINKQCLLSSYCETDRTLASQPVPNVKVEPLDGVEISNRKALDCPWIGNQISVKSEHVNNTKVFEDIIDHMMLGDRLRLLASRTYSKATFSNNVDNSTTFVRAGNDHKPTHFKSSKPFLRKMPRKRRRTVTDSIETALEEDAPGLLQVLVEKGVLLDEIKLYGEGEGEEALDESLVAESFSELEDVITKIFSQHQSFFKLAPVRGVRGEKASYCLACLISLVEQARYLRIRKSPVEWGWCRDLQSFIFVFEKHNRIVLERPEYGFATYFFELVDALPVHWQINRLVTTMKLTSCSRITLIENRALTVGDDLTEGEARVLMEYGWIPDSGLGTMLNYCDRVVHDRKNEFESDSSEWRSKIAKLLTDGYNGGIIVPNDIPKKVMEYGVGQSPQIKLEQ